MNRKKHKTIIAMILGVLLTYIFSGCSKDVSAGKFVALDSTNKIAIYSEDGINWDKSDRLPTADSWNCICYGNGRYIAIGYDIGNNSIVVYSPDGNKWTPITIDGTPGDVFSFKLVSVCYGNGKFVAVSEGEKVAYSTDGVNWKTNDFPSGIWKSICYGNGKFVAVDSGGKVAYSNNGINWDKKILLQNYSSTKWRSVCYGKGRFVAVAGEMSGYKYTAYSTNGIDWEESTTLNNDLNLFGVCYGDGKFVAVDGNINKAVYSYDGIKWDETSLPNIFWNSVCYGDGKFIAVSASEIIAYSTDGITWAEVNISIPDVTGISLFSITYGLDDDIFGFL